MRAAKLDGRRGEGRAMIHSWQASRIGLERAPCGPFVPWLRTADGRARYLVGANATFMKRGGLVDAEAADQQYATWAEAKSAYVTHAAETAKTTSSVRTVLVECARVV